jgi:hypothetical protein
MKIHLPFRLDFSVKTIEQSSLECVFFFFFAFVLLEQRPLSSNS